jgi:hypothetical protein
LSILRKHQHQHQHQQLHQQQHRSRDQTTLLASKLRLAATAISLLSSSTSCNPRFLLLDYTCTRTTQAIDIAHIALVITCLSSDLPQPTPSRL